MESTDGEIEAAAAYARDRIRVGDEPRVDGENLTWAGEDALELGTGAGAGRRLLANPDVTLCFERVRRTGELCTKPAGWRTSHPGVGRCRQHGGETANGRREAAWVVAHGFARELDVTPWEALLKAVRIAAGKVAYIEAKLATAYSDEQFLPEGTSQASGLENLNWWVKQSEYWHDRLMRCARLAIDAGVAERLVRQVELEAQLMLRAANLALDDAGIEGTAREKLLSGLAGHLLALEAGESNVIDSTSVEGNG